MRSAQHCTRCDSCLSMMWFVATLTAVRIHNLEPCLLYAITHGST